MNSEPIYKLAGLSYHDWWQLSKEERSKIRRRYLPFGIEDYCSDCGNRIEEKIPHWSEWMIGAFNKEDAQRIEIMGRKAAKESWENPNEQRRYRIIP